MLTIELTNGHKNPAITGEDFGTEPRIFLGPFKGIQVTYGIIRPKGMDGNYTSRELLIQNDYIFYKGVYYGDYHIYELTKENKELNNITRIQPIELEELEVADAGKRLKFIKTDLDDIYELLSREKVNPSNLYTSDGVTLNTLLTNIEIACNMNEDEVNSWKL